MTETHLTGDDLTMTTANTDQVQDGRYIPFGSLVYPLTEREKISRRYRALTNNEWIRFEPLTLTSQGCDDDAVGISRVFVLANDADNGRISRFSPVLRRQKKALLATLDFSSATWNGSPTHDARSNFPTLSPRAQATAAEDNEDMSLLNMFNAIPSPNPDIHSIQDDLHRQFMSDLLASTVGDLVTEMYPHQCRSAALMHQREVQPGRLLDPRLIEVVDQKEHTYYYNPVTGDAFREPRYYDAVCGGILAEEMGAGKTLICLALITATKYQPASVPEIFQGNNITVRPKVGSLMDMAAAAATKHACPWKKHLDPWYQLCIKAIQDNPGWYYRPRPKSRRVSRGPGRCLAPEKVYLSHATLIVVPPNLLKQWLHEISKHTKGLQVHVVNTKSPYKLLSHMELIQQDIILCSVHSLEKLWQEHRRSEQDGSWTLDCPLGMIQFKRCIVDEGHKLGNVKLSGVKTDLLQVLDALQISARWIVTGTPSQGLFGIEESGENNTTLVESTGEEERKDLERIGAIATLYLKARPWSNTSFDHGDTPAEWRVYVLQPKHSSKSSGRMDCLRSTINSLIIRHRLSEVSHILPTVDAKIVKLDGSYQDKLSLNLFSMMIIFNAVQSQRTDQDYLFHPKNRKSLLQLLSNLRQASFFGGVFYSIKDIKKAVQTAEEFLESKSVPMSEADRELLRSALDFGKIAVQNKIKEVATVFHEMPIYVQNFPGDLGLSWSMDEKDAPLICTNWKLMTAAQKALRPFLNSSADLNTFLNSGLFVTMGNKERLKEMDQARPQEQDMSKARTRTTLAGNTKLGEDYVSPRKGHSAPFRIEGMSDNGPSIPTPPQTPEENLEIVAALAKTQLVSTTSAKLSYLVDAIVTHQKEEQIIVFYESDSVAWYLSGILEMLQVHHLIYAKGISVNRRAQYIATFNSSSKFRVLLMDISQAAFGLDMRSASRIYFINPVLNPQVEAQAVGRVRRISQQRHVTVETLVLKDSLEEVIVERRSSMTQAEHRQCKTILDDKPLYEWILRARVIPLPDGVDVDDGPAQMARLRVPQYIFGREFGHEMGHADDDIVPEEPIGAVTDADATGEHAGGGHAARPDVETAPRTKFGRVSKMRFQSPSSRGSSPMHNPWPGLGKRARFVGDEDGESSGGSSASTTALRRASPAPPVKRARFTDGVDATEAGGVLCRTSSFTILVNSIEAVDGEEPSVERADAAGQGADTASRSMAGLVDEA